MKTQDNLNSKSISLAMCRELKHKISSFSPDGVEHIIECPVCCKVWLIKLSGEEIRLEGSIYEARLLIDRINKS